MAELLLHLAQRHTFLHLVDSCPMSEVTSVCGAQRAVGAFNVHPAAAEQSVTMRQACTVDIPSPALFAEPNRKPP